MIRIPKSLRKNRRSRTNCSVRPLSSLVSRYDTLSALSLSFVYIVSLYWTATFSFFVQLFSIHYVKSRDRLENEDLLHESAIGSKEKRKKEEEEEEDNGDNYDNDDEDRHMEKGPPIDEKVVLKKASASLGAAPAASRVTASTSSDGEDQTIVATEDRSKDDVLCGRGIPFQKWPGNQRMRRIVQKHRQEYAGAKRHEKGVIVQRVIREIKEGGARFLHPLVEDVAQDEVEQWVEAKNDYVYEKVSHAMRQKKRKSITAKSTKSLSSSSSRQGMGRPVGTGRKGVESTNATSLQASQIGLPVDVDAHPFSNPGTIGGGGVAGMHSALAGLGGLPGGTSLPTSMLNMNVFQSSMHPLPTRQDLLASPTDVPSLPGDELQKLLRIEQLRRQQLNIQMMRRDELLLQLQIEELQRRNASGTGKHQQPSNVQSILQQMNTSGILQLQEQQQGRLPSNQNTAAAAVSALNSSESGTDADVSSGGGTYASLPSDVQSLHRQLLEGRTSGGTQGLSSSLGGVDREIMTQATVGNIPTSSSSGAVPQSLGALSGLSQQQLQLLRLLEFQQQQRRDGGS
mmetsp:Transcript_36604/g.88363  ORF Transcript_36604/g.88363 Transcript_36604/m.88363 type:complete len:570 (-) Transcript_36604:6039-7748(-)